MYWIDIFQKEIQMANKYMKKWNFSYQAMTFFEHYYCYLCLGKYMFGGHVHRYQKKTSSAWSWRHQSPKTRDLETLNWTWLECLIPTDGLEFQRGTKINTPHFRYFNIIKTLFLSCPPSISTHIVLSFKFLASFFIRAWSVL